MPSFPAPRSHRGQGEYPRYISKGKLITDLPHVPSPIDASAKGIAAFGQVGDALAEVGQKWSEAYNRIQKTVSKDAFATSQLDLITRAEKEPDYNKSKQYFDELDKMRAVGLQGFSSPLAQTEMEVELNYATRATQIELQKIFRTKAIDAGQAATLSMLDKESSAPSEGFEAVLGYDPKVDADKQPASILATQVEAGIFSREEAYKIGQDHIEKAKFNKFLIDFRADPLAAEKEFNKTSYGMTPDMAEKARSKLKEVKAAYKEAQTELYADMGLRVMTGDLKESEIDAAMAANKLNPNEGITPTQGKQVKAALYRDITQRIGVKQFKKYRQALDFIFADSKQDRMKGYEAVLEAYADGLTKEEAGYLRQILDTKKDVIFSHKAAAGKKILEQLFGVRAKNVEEETSLLLDYARRITEGGWPPEDAARQTAKDLIQKDHPATVLDPDLGAVFSPSKGIRTIPKVKKE